MNILKLNLLEEKTQHDFMPTLTAYLLDTSPKGENKKRPVVIVIPGGGYGHCSSREGERIALSYSAAGFNTFILNYALAPHRHPLPILNAAKAIEIIRENAVEWNINPDMIAVCGFSAGGHLAASISNLWNDPEIFTDDVNINKLHKPNASVLCYPVITCGDHAHKGSFRNLTGSEEENELWHSLSLENRVSEETPSAFIWHTFQDSCVPVENSLLYAQALKKFDIPFELHIYPNGEHGLSTVSDEDYWSLPKFTREYPWIKQSIEWLYIQFGITKIEKE